MDKSISGSAREVPEIGTSALDWFSLRLVLLRTDMPFQEQGTVVLVSQSGVEG